MKFIPPKSGWRTYAVVVVGIGLGIAQHFNVHIPSYVDWGLAFLGMGTLRSAVKNQSAKSADDIAVLIQTVLAAVTEAAPVSDATGATAKLTPVDVRPLPPIT